MSHRGNISFKSIESNFDKLLGGYEIGDYVKSDDTIMMEYYLSLGYYVFLSDNLWKNLFQCIFWDDIKKDENENFRYALSFGYKKPDFPLSFDTKKIKNNFSNALEMLDKEFNYSGETLLKILDFNQLDLFDDFLNNYLDKQDNEVKKSFLEESGFNEELYEFSKYEYFNLFTEYFGDDFTKFMTVELEKHGINKKFFKGNILKFIFGKFSKNQICSILHRLNLNNESFGNFYPHMAYNGEEILFVFYWFEFNDWNYEETLWIDFLVSMGINVEIFTFNKSNATLSKLTNKIKENTIKLELFSFDDKILDGQEVPKLKKIDKLTIEDFNRLKDEMEILSQENNENLIIKLDGEEVSFDDIYDVFLCTLEKEENRLSKDYCCDYENFTSVDFHCKYLKEEFNCAFRSEDDFGEINDSGVWEFNKDTLNDKFQELVKIMKICPFFNYMDNKKALTKNSRKVNPKTYRKWCFVDNEGHFWYYLRKMWFNDEGSLDFPGISKMAGVKKTDYELRSRALAIIDEKANKEKEIANKEKEIAIKEKEIIYNKAQKSLFDF